MRARFAFVSLFFCALISLGAMTHEANAQQTDDDLMFMLPRHLNNVSLTRMDNYYQVIIDLSHNEDRYLTGRELMRLIKKNVPDVEYLYKSYLRMALVLSFLSLDTCIQRVADIKPTLEQDYIDEIDGMASMLSTTNNSLWSDTLSKDEFWVGALLPDVVRYSSCSACAIFGSASTNGNMIGRNLEWIPGLENQTQRLHSITVIKNGRKSICLIGTLGRLSVVSAFNTNRVFGAILDSPTEEPYSSVGKRSYVYDLRHALENYSTLVDVADYMKTNPYTYNHLIFLGDTNESQVLENNLGSPDRGLRAANSVLRSNVVWGMSNAIAAVNSFLLPSNFDNETDVIDNYARWDSFITQTSNRVYSGTVDIAGLKAIIGYHVGEGPGPYDEGNIYVEQLGFANLQSIVFVPTLWRLDIAFAPIGDLPDDPVYQTIYTNNPFL